MHKQIELGAQLRDLGGAAVAVRKEAEQTRLSFAASSTEPYDRYFGTEVLSHDAGAIRMDRIKRGAVPLLFNHNWDDPVGVVTGARIEGERLLVDAQMFATARAKEIETMVEGGLRNVSIGYRVHEFTVQEKTETYTATDWEPLEVSIVTVPADATVGIGRSASDARVPVPVVVRGAAVVQPAAQAASTGASHMAETQAAAGANADIQVINDGTQVERARVKALQALGRAHNVDAKTVDAWIDSGKTADEAAHACLQMIAERARTNPSKPAEVGLSRKEVERYSITRALNAIINKDWAKAGLELEASRAAAQRLGKTLNEHSFIIPLEIQSRDLIVATNTIGGYLVDTRNMSFTELMRNRSVLLNMGATRMGGLQGNVSIPKHVGAGTASWLATEATAATESTQTFGQTLLQPKNVAAYSEISRQLLLQSSPDAESLVMSDLATVVALAGDLAGLNGPGTGGQPTGIITTTGIGGVTIGTGGIDYGDVIEFQSDVASGNLLAPACGYVATPSVAGILMGKPRFTNSDTPIWGGNMLDGQMAGFRAMSSNQMPSQNLLFGDFSKVVWAEWGVLEVEVNPYANFPAGIVGVRAFYTMDIGIRYAGAFSLATGITA